ncbi:spore coat protein YlbD [Sporolactobacillus spathodeae]|uniref:Coat protein n=1 Tax=Sporolactobacillus spathodeae TaxID=1465502 RepID=A0ABS2QAE8_9BACL|nr:spore coat protein YlbD [Sporolactobacillus spathodeae]MBM7658310.1 hypothetical protein [Sporolactobacillus spathodeae]
MPAEKTSDTVKRFKLFVKSHPEIVAYVHQNKLKWNDVFDDWAIFGESPEIWKSYGADVKETAQTKEKSETTPAEKPSKNSGSTLSWNKILETIDTLDTTQWQERLDTLSSALGGLQTFIGQFKQQENSTGAASTPPNPPTARPYAGRTQRVYNPPRRSNRRSGFFRKD